MIPIPVIQFTRTRKNYDTSSSGQGTVAKISSGLGKIKVALRTNQPIEGAVFPHESHIIENEASPFAEDIISPEYGNIFRDLSAWRISIPTVDIQHVIKALLLLHF